MFSIPMNPFRRLFAWAPAAALVRWWPAPPGSIHVERPPRSRLRSGPRSLEWSGYVPDPYHAEPPAPPPKAPEVRMQAWF